MEPDEKTPETPTPAPRQRPKDAWLEQLIAEERDYGYFEPDEEDD